MAGQYKRRFGDRREGRLLRSLDPYNKLMPFIMAEKSDSCNFFEDSIEVTETDRWLRAKRAEGYKGLGMLHLFIATYVRAVAMRPGVNRFVAGQRIFSRRNIEVVMSIKRTLTADGEETSIKVEFEPTDTIFDVYRKLNAAIDENKATASVNGTDKAAAALARIPGVFLKFTVWLLKLLDYFDLLPKSLLKVSPFHGSMIITDLGSLGIPPIYHHLYNFGNLPVFLAFGMKRRALELDKSGAPVERKYIDYTAVLDERICDGMYYSTAFKYIKYYLRNPAQLEQPPERVEQDVF